MTTQTPTAPASEAGKCKCFEPAVACECPRYVKCKCSHCRRLKTPICSECGHDKACHTTSRADPGP